MYCNTAYFGLKYCVVREKFVAFGGFIAGAAIITDPGCTTPESEYIKGTVLDIRHEPEEIHIKEQTLMLSDCPPGTEHLSNRCTEKKPYNALVQVRDAKDIVIRVRGKNGEEFDTYVWPRVEKAAVIGGEIRIHPRHGSREDRNNEEKIISKTPIPER